MASVPSTYPYFSLQENNVVSDVRGRVLRRLVQGFCAASLLVFSAHSSFAQGTLTLSSAVAAADGSATLNLTLTGGSGPAGLQWTLTYSPTDIVSIRASRNVADKAINRLASWGSYAFF